MKTLTAIIALSLGIGATPIEAKECELVLWGKAYTSQEIVDKAEERLRLYENVSDKALASSGIELPKIGKVFLSEQIRKAETETDNKFNSASGFTPGVPYLRLDITYDRSNPGEGVPLEIEVTVSDFAHKQLRGAPTYVIYLPRGRPPRLIPCR